MSEQTPGSASPKWTSTTKLVVALVFATILIGLLIKFQDFIIPLLVAFIIAYLYHPVAEAISRKMHLSWRLSTTLIFLMTIIVVAGLLTVSGIAIVSQIQSLINFIQGAIRDLPGLITQWTLQPIIFGPFTIDLANLDLSSLVNSLLGSVQPLLSEVGTIVGGIASGAFKFLGWFFFSLVISYFILAGTGGVRERLIHFEIPGYTDDLKRIGTAVNRIWNAFLRGQFIIFIITIVIYNILLGSLGVRYFYGLSIMAGLARFIPYVGPWITWTTYGLVAYFQGTTLFGLSPIVYVILVDGSSIVVDNIIDTFIAPNLIANVLRLHPAAVMVAALIGLNLFGVIGMILAAPTLATLKLAFDYATAKMMDTDPWHQIELETTDALNQRYAKRTKLAEITKSFMKRLRTSRTQQQENEINDNKGIHTQPKKGA